jgi:hypothetical protein
MHTDIKLSVLKHIPINLKIFPNICAYFYFVERNLPNGFNKKKKKIIENRYLKIVASSIFSNLKFYKINRT